VNRNDYGPQPGQNTGGEDMGKTEAELLSKGQNEVGVGRIGKTIENVPSPLLRGSGSRQKIRQRKTSQIQRSDSRQGSKPAALLHTLAGAKDSKGP